MVWVVHSLINSFNTHTKTLTPRATLTHVFHLIVLSSVTVHFTSTV